MKPKYCAPAGLALILSASTLFAQGYSYDVSSSGTDPRNGAAVVMSASHGRFANGLTRLDVTESMAMGGPTQKGTYTLSNAATGVTTFVNPAKKSYVEMNGVELAKESAGVQNALGGVARMEVTNIHVDLEDLGAGEKVEGYATLKYRLTEAFTMRMTVMGHASEDASHSVMEIWVAPQLAGIMNPSARPPAFATTGPMAELTSQVYKAFAKVKPGVILRTVHTSTSGEGARARTQVVTMSVSNVKREAIAASVFQVPAGYTRMGSMLDALQQH